MGSRTLAVAAAWLAVALPSAVPAMALGSGQDQSAASRRIRAANSTSASLVPDGLRRSETFRKLVAEIEASDVVAFIMASPEPGQSRGATRLISSPTGPRMLVVTISLSLDRDERLAVLGHELQHVREVAANPNTVDTDGMRRLFVKIGDQISPTGDELETRAAQTVEQRIRVEMERRR